MFKPKNPLIVSNTELLSIFETEPHKVARSTPVTRFIPKPLNKQGLFHFYWYRGCAYLPGVGPRFQSGFTFSDNCLYNVSASIGPGDILRVVGFQRPDTISRLT